MALGNAAYGILSNIILGKIKEVMGAIGMDLEMEDL